MPHTLPLLAQEALNPGFLALGAIIFVLFAVALLVFFKLRKPKP